MQNNLETKESNKNLANPVVNKVSKGKKFYGINNINYKINNQINTNTKRIIMLKMIMILY